LPVSLVALDDQIDESLTTERALAALSTGFGVVAVLLAVVGLYGVMAFVAAQRRKEIGLRVALGATRAAAIWLMVRGALVIVGVGLAVAVPAVWGLQQLSDRVTLALDLVETQIFGVQAFDAPTIAAAGATLALVAVAAAAIPAWRASRVDPNAALRVE
jgi:ABC-type antimicrobial peptide transport system permease subunit